MCARVAVCFDFNNSVTVNYALLLLTELEPAAGGRNREIEIYKLKNIHEQLRAGIDSSCIAESRGALRWRFHVLICDGDETFIRCGNNFR